MDYILRYVLPSLLGNFISGIDKNNMRTSFFSGKVSLEKVFLNPNLLKSLQIPVKIVYSDIGKLELKIPWMKRLKEPIEIYLEDLCVLLESVESLEDYDIFQDRMSFLDKLTEQITQKVKSLDETSQDKEGSLSYYKVLILDNFQLKIKNVHIRFEDINKGYSMGFTLDELSVNTIDENGQLKFIDRTIEENKSKDLRKRAIIKDLSFYWNSKERVNNFITQNTYLDNVRRAFLVDTVLRSEKKEPGVDPILMISAQSDLIFKSLKNKKKEDDPRYKIELDFKPFTVSVKSNQVSQIISLGEFITSVLSKRKNKYTLPELNDEDLFSITDSMRRSIEDIIFECDDDSFRWSEELENVKRKALAEPIKKGLLSLPNKLLGKLCKETILQAKKKKILSKLEKKTQSRSFLSKLYWKDNNSTEEEITKVNAYFDAFNVEDTENMDLLTKGFIFQFKIRINECNIDLIHQSSQKGVSAKFSELDIGIDRKNDDNVEITVFDASIRETSLFYTQLNQANQFIKKIPVMRSNPSKQLANINFTRKLMEKAETREIKCQVSETEFQWIPEFLIVLKKMFTFRQASSEAVFANMAYEKFADMQKNAEEQIKHLMDYSSTLYICVMIASVNLIIPLTPVLGLESDCWVLSIKNVDVATKPPDPNAEYDFNQFSQVLENVNFKYYSTINLYHACKLDPKRVPSPEHLFTLLEDMRIFIETKIVEDTTYLPEEVPELYASIEFDVIKFNMSKDIYRKTQALKACFDFSSEKEFNDYLETEKKLIMTSNDGLFKVYHKKNFEIGESWTKYILVSSGFYLYFYESASDTSSKMHIYMKKAKITVEKKEYDMPYVLKIKSRYADSIIAMEREEDVQRFVRLIENKNNQFFNSSAALDVDNLESSKITRAKSELDLQKINHQKIKLVFKLKKTLFNFVDDNFKVADEAKIENLLIEVIQRPLDQNIKISLKAIHLKDYRALKNKQQDNVFLISSQAYSLKEFARFEMQILDERHPKFIKNMTKREFDLLFDNLDINWIPERFFYVATFFSETEADSMGMEGSYRIRKASFTQRKSSAKKETTGMDESIKIVRPPEKNFIMMKGKVKISNLTYKLTTRKSYICLAQLSINSFSMDIEKDTNRSIFKGKVENLKGYEMTGYNQYQRFENSHPHELIGFENNQSYLEFSFEGREPHYVKKLGTIFHNELIIKGKGVRIKYIQQPVIRIINYIMNFIMSFDFGFDKDIDQKIKEARQTVAKEGFTSFELVIEKPKIIVQSKPNSYVFFELDMDTITVKNTISDDNGKRILIPIPGLEKIYLDTYIIQTSDITFSKVVKDTKKTKIANLFKLDLTFERSLWFEELILVHDIVQFEKYDYIDKSFMIIGNITPVLLKVNQEDYLDVMDCIFLNVINDDYQDSKLHIDDEIDPELQAINCPTPINLIFNLDYFSVVVIDQMVKQNILAKLTALINKIEFLRDRFYDKKVNIYINNVSGEFFEDVDGKNTEKTLFGCDFQERDFKYDFGDLTLEKIAEIDNEKIILQKDKYMKDQTPHFKIEIDMKSNLNKEFVFHLTELKIFLMIGIIMRLKDVFMLYGEKEEDGREANNNKYKTMKGFKVILDKTEIILPAFLGSNIKIKGKILFAFDKYDIVTLLEKKNEELVSSSMRINLDENEVFITHSKQGKHGNSFIKRSIVLPFSFQYTTTENVFFEKTNSVYLSKRDSSCIIGQVLVRASAVDSISFAGALRGVLEDMEIYRGLPKFPETTGYTENIILNPVPTIQVRFLYEKITLLFDGLQFKSINDFSGLSVPFLDFSLYTEKYDELKLEKTSEIFQGKIKLYFSSNYFNSRVGMWEPIVETWPLVLDIDISKTRELNKRIDIISDKDLNVNFSDEQVQILLTAYYDWILRFEEVSNKIKKEVPMVTREPSEDDSVSRRSSRTMTSVDIISEKNDTNENKVEYVSPYTIWNDTGYRIKVKPSFREKKDLDIYLALMPGDEKDLLMESSIDQIFGSSSNQNVLNSNKTNVEIFLPRGTINIEDIDVHNIGSKTTQIELGNKKFSVICSVYNYRTKKLVRFSSKVVIKNLLNIPIFVKIHEDMRHSIENDEKDSLIASSKLEDLSELDNENYLEISPNTSKSLPVDKLDYLFSFGTNLMAIDEQSMKFNPLKIQVYDQTELNMGVSTYGKLRVEEFRGYSIVYIEPLIMIKSCVPFEFGLNIISHDNQDYNNLAPQEIFYVTEYSSETELSIRIEIEGKMMKSNKFVIQPYTPKSSKELYLEKYEKKVNLDVYFSSQIKSYTRMMIIYAKVCIINETTDKFVFYSEKEKSDGEIITGHELMVDGYFCYIFDDISTLRIKSESSQSVPSEQILLSRFDTIHLDIQDSPTKYYNITVRVGQELVDREFNLFTTVVSVTPKFVFLNSTKRPIQTYLELSGSMTIKTIAGGEKVSLHFFKREDDKIMLVDTKEDDRKGEKWEKSGLIDVSSPGDTQFMCQTESKATRKFFNLNITLQKNFMLLNLEEQNSNEASILLKNNTDGLMLEIEQKGIQNTSFQVPPKVTTPFSWIEPFEEKKIDVKVLHKEKEVHKFTCELDTIGEMQNSEYMVGEQKHLIYYKVSLEGSSRVIRFFNSAFDRKVSNTSFIEKIMLIRAKIPSFGISLISAAGEKKVELFYIKFSPVEFFLERKHLFTSFHLRIKSLKIDNNSTEDQIYPLMVFPENSAKIDKGMYPFFDLIIRMNNRSKLTDILYIKDFGLYLDETNFYLDGQSLNGVAEFTRSINKILTKTVRKAKTLSQYIFLSRESRDEVRRNNFISWKSIEPRQSSSEFVYIEKLIIQPIIINLSFKNIQFNSGSTFIFNFIKKSLGKALANFDRAPLRLTGIELTGTYGTKANVFGTMLQRYKKVTIDTVMGIFLSSNILGNPGKFFNGISSGFNDLFDIPSREFQKGPLDGMVGIAKGAGSFFGKTIGATFDSVHNIADAVASGMIALSGDTDYMVQRERVNQQRNNNVIVGTYRAGCSIAGGIYYGLAGVIEMPVQHGMKEGVKGFFKGVWKGFRGLVFKPTTGVIDGVSKFTEGISNNLMTDPGRATSKSRPPRVFYGRQRIYKAYNQEEAIVYAEICKIKPKKYRSFTLMDCVFWKEMIREQKDQGDGSKGKEHQFCLVIMLEELILFNTETKKTVWKIKTINLEKVDLENRQFSFRLRNKKKKTDPVMKVSDQKMREKINLKMEFLTKIVNQTE